MTASDLILRMLPAESVDAIVCMEVATVGEEEQEKEGEEGREVGVGEGGIRFSDVRAWSKFKLPFLTTCVVCPCLKKKKKKNF